jgi:hypothetical protein
MLVYRNFFFVEGVCVRYSYLDEQTKNLFIKKGRTHERTYARTHASYMLTLAIVLLRVTSEVASCLSVFSFLS